MKTKVLFFTLVYLFTIVTGYTQILDDSTKLLYGPKTTGYVLEKEIYANKGVLHTIDTTLDDFHNFEYIFQGKYLYQNLGNLGTPLGNIYYQPSGEIGKSLGFTTFTPYAINPSTIKYYDTRSPYTSVTYIQSVNGQQVGDAEFSRNIKPNWNGGFKIRRFTTNKLIGLPTRGERQSEHTSFLFNTRYFTKDSAYQLLANFTVMDHKNLETGGVVQDSADDNLFDYKEENVFLRNSISREKRTVFHLYHEWNPAQKLFQVFHVMDYHYQSNRFNASLNTDTLFYPNRDIVLPDSFNTAETTDRTTLNLFENKAGLKGTVSRFDYSFYYRRKDFSYDPYYVTTKRGFAEQFAGGSLALEVVKNYALNVSAEYMFTGNQFSSSLKNDYTAKAELTSPYINGGYQFSFYSPSLLQLEFTGNNLQWNNRDVFQNSTLQHFYVTGHLKTKNFSVSPSVNYAQIKDLVYFDTLALPTQHLGKTINYFSADLALRFRWKGLNFQNFTRYAYASEVLQVPELFNHTRMYYQNRLFKVLTAQLGFDLFWKSDYFANAYMPITQQYYINNSFEVENYLVADVFLNLHLKSVSGFLKFSHVNQGWVKDSYFITPYYPGIPRSFVFGIRWRFFD